MTVAEVSVPAARWSGWLVVATPNRTCDLQELVNGVREMLGLADLAADRHLRRCRALMPPDR